MKRFLHIITCFAIAAIIISTTAYSQVPNQQDASNLKGAWQLKDGSATMLLLITNQHYSLTSFDRSGKKFHYTEGGRWSKSTDGKTIQTTTEFNSADPSKTGKAISAPDFFSRFAGNSGSQTTSAANLWKQVDAGGGQLNGTWRISEREQNGQMYEIKAGARKTIKILTGTCFQWAAINTETGEFFGTGGGHYTFKDGRYTEQIEFFSRDSSRVGIQLAFEGEVNKNEWHHRGKSSKGDPIHEIWRRED